MATGKNTFIFYCDWDKLINAMPSEKAGELLKLMLAYVNDRQPEEPTDPFIIMAWAHIRPMLKKDLKTWEVKKQKFSDMGKKSAAKRNAGQRKSTQVKRTLTVNDNVNVNVNDNVNVNVSSKEDLRKNLLESTFEIWWNLYDKKIDRDKCSKKFLKLTQDEMKQCIEHTEVYVQATPEKQYRRNPQTYLNNKNFKDEIITKKDKRSVVDQAQQFRNLVDQL